MNEVNQGIADYIQSGVSAYVDPNSVEGAQIVNLHNTIDGMVQNGNNDYCSDIKPAIQNWETTVNNNSSYTTQQKEALLIYSSVLRQSLHLWGEQGMQQQGTVLISGNIWEFAAVDALATLKHYIINEGNNTGLTRITLAIVHGVATSVRHYLANDF